MGAAVAMAVKQRGQVTKRCFDLAAKLRVPAARAMAVSCKGTKQALIDCLKMSPCMQKGTEFQECLKRPEGGAINTALSVLTQPSRRRSV